MQLYFTFPEWKRNTLTFTYDDGTIHDRRMVDIFNRFGIKGTFNLSVGRLGPSNYISRSEITSLYQGHEIASHGYRHLHLNRLTPSELRAELRDGRSALEDITGAPVLGFASPFGEHGANAVEAMRETGFAYARSTAFTGGIAAPYDWMNWAPTAHHGQEIDNLVARMTGNDEWGGCLRLLNIMGHSYEFERNNNWDFLEKLCATLSGRDNIWYATNLEIRNYIEACRNVRISMDGAIVENLSTIPIYANYGNGHGEIDTVRVKLMPGEEVNLRNPAKPESVVQRKVEISGEYEVYSGGPFTPTYPDWKMKALTFSYDDGSHADRRLVDILNRYGMKGTFNLNSDGREGEPPANPERDDHGYPLYSVMLSEYKSLYEGHEIAVHGAQHGTYNWVPYPCVVDDIYRNRLALEEVTGHPVRGMAYPCGLSAKNPQADTVLKALGVVYARVTGSTRDFALPSDFMNWRPTAHHREDIDDIAERFLALDSPAEPKLCYIWGHAIEFVRAGNWNVIEEFCKKMSGKEDIWYATNIAIYEYISAVRQLKSTLKGDSFENDTPFTIYGYSNGKKCVIPPKRR